MNKLKGVRIVPRSSSRDSGTARRRCSRIFRDHGATVITDELGYKLETRRRWTISVTRRRSYRTNRINHHHRRRRGQVPHRRPGEGSRGQIEARSRTTIRRSSLERVAKLAGGIAVIKVGAAVRGGDEGEEITHRRRAQCDEGRGGRRHRGGWRSRSPASAAKALEGAKFANHDQEVGAGIVARALSYPVNMNASSISNLEHYNC